MILIGKWGACTFLSYIVSFFREMGKVVLGYEIATLLSDIHYAGKHAILDTLSLAVKPEIVDEHFTP